MPLAITHGWPGSIYEFNKVIGPLTDPVKYGGRAADAVHVVAISLPGFGFSGKPRDRGYSPEKAADIIAKLMARLGYTRYGLQGGDWGGIISRIISHQRCAARRLAAPEFLPRRRPTRRRSQRRRPAGGAAAHAGTQAYMANERAYQQIQGTKPRASAMRWTTRRRPRRVDRREVSHVVRLRRQRRKPLHEGRPA
jgi:pimeloyl-ACP methyl ester carboxylesterase